MYTFCDKGGEELSLRPEGTAAVIRAVISNGLTQSLPLKLISDGPMMRYERPQKGRTRQFHQVSVECLGIASPLADVETIALGAQILEKIGILKRVKLEINTLGDKAGRDLYRQKLVDYLTPLSAHLSPDSQVRLLSNPLRILDSKNMRDQELLEKAPDFLAGLSIESRKFFDEVCKGLERLRVVYTFNPRIVRGLDYYCHTAFEFTTTEIGSQGAVLAGGRYDGLVSQMGGPEIAGVGWAMGVDRVALMLETLPSQVRPVAVIAVGDDTIIASFDIAMALRAESVVVHFSHSGTMAKRMKSADRVKAVAAVIIGENEIASGQATVRHLDGGEQNLVAFADLRAYLMNTFKL
jgi:histidyl-tRNA synthetase